MPQQLVNFYTVSPSDLKAGDVLACIVTAHIDKQGFIRFYRCPWPNAELYDGIPQGDRIWGNTVSDLFPALQWRQGADGEGEE